MFEWCTSIPVLVHWAAIAVFHMAAFHMAAGGFAFVCTYVHTCVCLCVYVYVHVCVCEWVGGVCIYVHVCVKQHSQVIGACMSLEIARLLPSDAWLLLFA